ncbi:maltose permease [Penicillium canescens]|uniref:Maltose permease n=1 Tax=Penicillium canescens TaxID=5083 RepID=A0AAD6ICM6_PENCN|nr:maltose permease [Penicillium canescens]KAJ6042992.1 maltose permease [Penicillium canescens]KAJ6054465.1 maltose permease [Penicillium canescens]KAJ6073411.1 maltose permease [Penicillium canescens]
MDGLKKSEHAVQDDVDLEGPTVHDNDLAVADLSFKDQLMAAKHHRRAVLAAFACSTTPILIGYDLTLVGSIIANTQFIRQFGVYDQASQAWSLPADHQLVWSIVQYVTAMVVAIVSGSLNDTFGRRVCFLLTVGLAVVGTFVELFSTNWKVWIVAKLFMGATMGSMQANTQTFVSEITPTAIRGLTLSLFQFWIIVGQLIASCVLEGTSHLGNSWSWRGAVVSQFGPALFCLAMFFAFVPESPYYLVSQSKIADARASLARLRPRNTDINTLEEEVREMQATLEHESQLRAAASSISYLECFQGTNLRRTLLACLPVVMQILTGYPLCGNYLSYFLTLSGIHNAFLITMISTIVSLLAALAAFILIERVGRRPQMLTGCYGMLACLLVISILGFEGLGQGWNYRALAAFCIIWALFYFSSVGAVGWAIVGEISSSRLRAKTTSLAALSSSLFNMAWSIAIPYLVNKEDANLGAKSGLIFLGMGFVCTGICFFALPETKGRSFGALDALFEARTPARKF